MKKLFAVGLILLLSSCASAAISGKVVCSAANVIQAFGICGSKSCDETVRSESTKGPTECPPGQEMVITNWKAFSSGKEPLGLACQKVK